MKKINTFLKMLFCMLMISPQVYSAQESTEEESMDFTQQLSIVDDLFADISEANPSVNINFTDVPLSLLSAPLIINQFEPEIDLFTSFTPPPSSNVTISPPTTSAHQIRTKSSCLAGIHRVGPCGCKAPTRQFQYEHDSLAACTLLSNQNFLIDERSDASLVLPESSTAFNIDTESSAIDQSQKQVHNGKKHFTCDICSKGFTRSSNLKAHARIHTGEKSFRCNTCNKSFAYSSHLKEHQRIHAGEKPYQCDQCSKSFTQSSTLKTHKQVHIEKKSYQCDQCCKSFTKSSYLKTHQQNKHKTNTLLPHYQNLQQPSAISTNQLEQSPFHNGATEATDQMELESQCLMCGNDTETCKCEQPLS